MKKFLGILLAFFLFYFLMSPVQAFDKNKAIGVLNLPDEAKTQDVVSLGHIKNPKGGRDIQGIAIISRGKNKDNNKIATPSASPTTIIPSTGTSALTATTACYSYTLGAHWKNFGTPWVINPTNSRGLSGSFLLDTQSADIAIWEDAADGTIGDGGSINIS